MRHEGRSIADARRMNFRENAALPERSAGRRRFGFRIFRIEKSGMGLHLRHAFPTIRFAARLATALKIHQEKDRRDASTAG